MQVFVPEYTLSESVQCLDESRLGNQIWREAKTIIKGGWPNHPASIAWSKNKQALAKYCLYGLTELYVNRGDISKQTFDEHWNYFRPFLGKPVGEYAVQTKKVPEANPLHLSVLLPWWWGDKKIHESHQSNLLRKDYVYYSQFEWKVQPRDGYVWPSPRGY